MANLSMFEGIVEFKASDLEKIEKIFNITSKWPYEITISNIRESKKGYLKADCFGVGRWSCSDSLDYFFHKIDNHNNEYDGLNIRFEVEDHEPCLGIHGFLEKAIRCVGHDFCYGTMVVEEHFIDYNEEAEEEIQED